MLSGFYTAGSGILTQQRVINVLTNNIANIQTPGFRAERVVSKTFDFELMTRMEQGNTQTIGVASPIREVREVPVDWEMSSLQETERPFDMALVGEGYFNILGQAPQLQEGDPVPQDGEAQEEGQLYLTRNGHFNLDEEGYLVLDGVGRVLGQKGEIDLGGSSNFTVDPDGTVWDDRGRKVDVLMITKPTQEGELVKVDNGLYTLDENNTMEADDVRVVQNALEQPNIDINRELTLVMEAQRALQSCSQALKIVDSMNQKASTQIAAL